MAHPGDVLRTALAERYRIGAEIGAGGMGTVYLADDLKHDRKVAIKALGVGYVSPVGSDRFLREVEIAAKLSHPHIVPLHDSGQADGVLYFVMPYVEGTSLKKRLEATGPLAVDEALRICRDVADGLAYAHARGFVHRDIKPGNILLTDRHALIVDFGVARAAEMAASSALTVPGSVIGTPLYMSPEQFGEEVADARSDIYSLGCVLYEMLAGVPPFRGETALAVLAGHVQGKVPPISTSREELPPVVRSIVHRMLAKDPGERYQTAEELLDPLGAALSRTGAAVMEAPPGPRASRLRAVAVFAVAVVATAVVVTSMSRRADPLSVTGEAESVVVIPYHDAASTPEEKALLVDLADELTRQLNHWESVRAVPQLALAGISFDLELSGPTLERIDDGVRVAAEAGVRTLVTLTARLRGDSAVVTASQFDRNGRAIGRPAESVGLATDRFRIGARLAHGLLGLDGPVEAVEELRLQSANPVALNHQAQGRRYLEAWQLLEAEAAFRSAIDQDPAFAMAHHHLAITLYWQAERDATRLASLGPEIGRESLAAIRNASGLPAKDSAHIEGFYNFQLGDYEAARRTFRTLVERDPTDVYALLLLGTVETKDPWLIEQSDGSLFPRRNLNTALASFRETVRLSPGFHLGYGHLFEITEQMLETALSASGVGFQAPPTELISPWETLTPYNLVAFYPVARDSIEWLRLQQFEALADRGPMRDGADELLRSSMRTLQRWAAFAPNESRPLDELVDWTLRVRQRLPRPVSPATLDSLAVAALGYAERAIALMPDSTPLDLLRLGSLKLATGDAGGAEATVDRAQALLDAEPERPGYALASNVFLYRGKPSRALAILERERLRTRNYTHPSTGAILPEAGAERTIERLRILGATAVTGAALSEELAALAGSLSPSVFDPEALRFVKDQNARRISTALALVEGVAREWLQGTELTDPMWPLVTGQVADPAGIAEGLRLSEAAEDRDVIGAERSYILGRAAQRSGNHRDAARLFARLDSIPLSVSGRDPGWGLLSLSRFHRAQSYEALGDTAKALEFYELFANAWNEADSLVPGFSSEAERALSRLGFRSNPTP